MLLGVSVKDVEHEEMEDPKKSWGAKNLGLLPVKFYEDCRREFQIECSRQVTQFRTSDLLAVLNLKRKKISYVGLSRIDTFCHSIGVEVTWLSVRCWWKAFDLFRDK